MQEVVDFYKDQIQENTTSLARLKQQLFYASMLRLVVFGVALFGVYFLLGQTRYVLAVVLVASVIFGFLVSKQAELQYQHDTIVALLALNTTELEVLDRKFHHLPEGAEFKDPLHAYSQDIDLFGRGSFYQYCNRTVLQQGSETLAHLFTENTTDQIAAKQEGIQELSRLPKWRQGYSAVGSMVKTETSYATIIKWMAHYTPFVPEIMKWLPKVFSIASIILLVVYYMDFISGWLLTGWFFLGLAITGNFLKPINTLSAACGKIQSTFQQYQKLLAKLEEIEFQSELLKSKREVIMQGTEKTSKTLKHFANLLNALDQRNNMLIGFLANGFLLRDLQIGYAIEKWITKNSAKTESWFQVIAFFDAYNSLGNFSFNHPSYVFPARTDTGVVLNCKGAGHPLLSPEKCVLNDIQIDRGQFFIITGANMAGKSTFLRTVSLQIMMANVGLPVYATASAYSPIKLITSMRTSDSLTDDESYFFSELKRLRYIVDEIQKDEYFIVLDEILKGTNSTDKAKGSRKFLERLVGSRSTGIIATHDLSLCEVSKEYPQIENHYFDAEIIDGELHFDYTFKKGICQNMNASFLLKKMGIVN